MNVLVYTGPGTSRTSIRHTFATLRPLLTPHYALIPIESSALLSEPWQSTTSLLIIPGGRDIPYCNALNGDGNRMIAEWVRKGGRYLGFCAGGYFGSGRVEFEEGVQGMEVVGSRELKFFPGTCRGTAFEGFVYNTEAGARGSKLSINTEAMGKDVPESFTTYYNGGGLFVDADNYSSRGIRVLSRYADKPKVPGGDASVVYCPVGKGAAVLFGTHPEYSPAHLNPQDGDGPEYAELIALLSKPEENGARVAFMRAVLNMLELKIVPAVEGLTSVPSLTPLMLSSVDNGEGVRDVLDRLRSSGTDTEDGFRLEESNDTFLFRKPMTEGVDMSSLSTYLPSAPTDDLNSVIKLVDVYGSEPPAAKTTPFFDHAAYYNALLRARSTSSNGNHTLGSPLMYSEIVTSSQTLLDKNFNFLTKLPAGFTILATHQIAGRGRGNNAWVSPPGVLAFSTILRHPRRLLESAPVVFVQYLVSLSIVEAIRQDGYEELDVRIKWPNDIYAKNPTPGEGADKDKGYVKIGGILVNSSFENDDFVLVVGCGINTTNSAPTTSLNHVLEAHNTERRRAGRGTLPPIRMEKLLARIMVKLEDMYTIFAYSTRGFRAFESLYYDRWLHTDQLVRLEMESDARARIVGITMDHGLLEVEEVDAQGRGMRGRRWHLQADGNSFDMFKGLLKRKA
ncbi:biotin-protein ligase [Saitoella complicata NRRL Y-17804]|uniref:BPL/LPL catalytic domain-containing protein n=1 Tax=Saitoella complicata (strain BCRC 22490 / CBS 7301 / JCM 7358 / NBRC 10748 / NRRL Y-17804) TaxID=698492 RepID=A0A0E9NQQ9_SAICN|nr:biotin-protein ligase [Saitoella complicata NRRL Y-17804]ODQ50298.1 biotin-protein ligase [Saitoella complicata NRRL Y-17804]GAO52133.1 hypothetical protein G7K_6219-t1 [Saitoella complicata NRRL Y-17804]